MRAGREGREVKGLVEGASRRDKEVRRGEERREVRSGGGRGELERMRVEREKGRADEEVGEGSMGLA